MYVVRLTKEKGRVVGYLLDGQLDLPADTSNRVTIPSAVADIVDINNQLIGCDNLEWSDKRKSWTMLRPILTINLPIPGNSTLLREGKIHFNAEDMEKYVSKSFMSELDDKDLSVTIETDGYYISEDVWRLLVRNIRRRGRNYKNTLIVGPSGCGKTTLIQVACKKLGIQFSKFDMGACSGDATGTLLGVHRIEDGKSVFDYSDFVRKIQEPGVIVLDEINRADQSAMNILYPVLDDTRALKVDIAGSSDKRTIKVHPDCIFVATANVGSEYSGTNEMDAALVNRFIELCLTDLPEDKEIAVLQKKCGIEEDSARVIVKTANSLRDNFTLGKISYKVSIRETLEVADLVFDGYDEKTALKAIFLPKFTGSLTEGEQSIVAQTIDSF